MTAQQRTSESLDQRVDAFEIRWEIHLTPAQALDRAGLDRMALGDLTDHLQVPPLQTLGGVHHRLERVGEQLWSLAAEIEHADRFRIGSLRRQVLADLDEPRTLAVHLHIVG